jgi:HEPN domain-containing protein
MSKQTKQDPLTDEQLAHLVANAAGFFETARRAAKLVRVGNTDQFRAPLPAAIACLAFSAELLLKALIEIGGNPAPNEHKLDKLFALIDEPSEDKVRECLGRSGVDLDVLIGSARNAFVEWRYWHEEPENLALQVEALKEFVIVMAHVASKSGRVPDIKSEFIWDKGHSVPC